jgi:hypothetical protein
LLYGTPEILVSGTGAALFYRTRGIDNAELSAPPKAQALLFYAFDVLIYQGRSLLKVSLCRISAVRWPKG